MWRQAVEQCSRACLQRMSHAALVLAAAADAPVTLQPAVAAAAAAARAQALRSLASAQGGWQQPQPQQQQQQQQWPQGQVQQQQPQQPQQPQCTALAATWQHRSTSVSAGGLAAATAVHWHRQLPSRQRHQQQHMAPLPHGLRAQHHCQQQGQQQQQQQWAVQQVRGLLGVARAKNYQDHNTTKTCSYKHKSPSIARRRILVGADGTMWRYQAGRRHKRAKKGRKQLLSLKGMVPLHRADAAKLRKLGYKRSWWYAGLKA